MKTQQIKRSLAQLYLTLVPFLTIVLGLGVGYISYKIYLPVWLLNVLLMIICMWTLGASRILHEPSDNRRLIICAVCFIIPTLLTSMFFGLGAPPYESPEKWVASVTEQRCRYYFLLTAGLFIPIAFAILAQQLKKRGDDFYTVIGLTAIQIAAPVFLINMSFWGFYLTRMYQLMVNSHSVTTPEWVSPIRNMFYYVNVFSSALVYLGSAAFAISLKKTRLFKPAPCNIYLVTTLILAVLCVLPPSFPEPFATLNFIVSIPAVPFMVPYFMGVNLLRRLN